jgi:ketosteroid isomerase-like protein
MATDATIVLVQAAYADFQRGDIPSLLARLTDDILWTTPAPPEIVPYGGSLTGKDGVLRFFERLGSSFDMTKFDPSEFIASEDRVIALVSIAGNVRATGMHAVSEAAHLFRIRNGKISEFREYVDTRSVVAAFAPQTAAAQGLRPLRAFTMRDPPRQFEPRRRGRIEDGVAARAHASVKAFEIGQRPRVFGIRAAGLKALRGRGRSECGAQRIDDRQMVLRAQQFGQFDKQLERAMVVVRTPGRRFELRDRVRIEIAQAVPPVGSRVKAKPERDSERCGNHRIPDLHRNRFSPKVAANVPKTARGREWM